MAELVHIVEVGPRDGLQNEPFLLSPEVRAQFVRHLADSGLQHIEVGSLVSPKWVPQMAQSEAVYAKVSDLPNRLGLLVPNVQGLQLALKVSARDVAIFVAASETFNQKNLNCSVTQSLDEYQELTAQAIRAGVRVRAYVSCIAGCPYEGAIDSTFLVHLVQSLIAMGCYEVSLGDTIGVATPNQIAQYFIFAGS